MAATPDGYPPLVAEPALILNGIRILESVWLTVNGEPYQDWVPCGRSGWSVKRWIVPQVPHPGALQIDAFTVLMHPATVAVLKQRLRDQR